jgi:hypothetical protein
VAGLRRLSYVSGVHIPVDGRVGVVAALWPTDLLD